MACRVFGDAVYSDAHYSTMAEVDKLTDMLCGVLRSLPLELLATQDDSVREWFERHKEWDRAREAQETRSSERRSGESRASEHLRMPKLSP